ncbi:helix-turn-helix transcriptional regulator [Streptomyces sp. NPDC001027]|uniref:helix-turn-helix domain-containing protein n=1 Tax=Streptomyces sp. NPDC001027 TaxID=3154771 RepID=UPI003323FB08
MGRRTKELPIESDTSAIVKFAASLRELREKAGNPTLASMAKETGVSTASLSKAAGGHELPSWRTTKSYVEVCGADPKQWRNLWEAIRREMRPKEFISGDADESLNLTPEQRRRASWPRMWARWDRTGMILPSHRSESLLDLRLAMQSLQNYRSLSLRQLARLMPYSHSTVASVLSGTRPVTAFFLRSFLQACGATSLNEVIQWMDLLSTADPSQRAASHIRIAPVSTPNSSSDWRPGLPVSEEIERLRKFSLRKRSDHLRSWLLSRVEERARRALYRRMEKAQRINASHLTLFERGEWSLTLDELNKLAMEAKQRWGYEDIDPVIESTFSDLFRVT